jgi:hypothetical protein
MRALDAENEGCPMAIKRCRVVCAGTSIGVKTNTSREGSTVWHGTERQVGFYNMDKISCRG